MPSARLFTEEMSLKVRALLDGAVSVFAEDGYSRASIDKIARCAGVSSRTIYNRYGSKAGLFRAAIVASARHVADLQVGIVRDCLGAVGDESGLRHGLTAFAHAWDTPDPRTARHFALVRQVRADVEHIPSDALAAWQESGPRRVQAEIAAQIDRLAGLGLLALPGTVDAWTAAAHLVALSVAGANTHRLRPGEDGEADARWRAEAAVHTFLHGLGAPGPTPR